MFSLFKVPKAQADGDKAAASSKRAISLSIASRAVGPDDGSLRATPQHVRHCFESILYHFDGKHSAPAVSFVGADASAPFFVTLRKWNTRNKDYLLRGCIGTLTARPLTDLWRYARKSAFEDRRFDPVEADEVPHLEVCVSLLVDYQKASAWDDWDIGIHGIIIDFRYGGEAYSATYLPEVAEEQGWNHRQAVESLVRKAGVHQSPCPNEVWSSISVTRYRSSKAAMTYSEYKKWISTA